MAHLNKKYNSMAKQITKGKLSQADAGNTSICRKEVKDSSAVVGMMIDSGRFLYL